MEKDILTVDSIQKKKLLLHLTINNMNCMEFLSICWRNFNKRKNKWAAEISKDKKKYFLGYHDKEIDAAKASDKMALKLYGENAKLNFATN